MTDLGPLLPTYAGAFVLLAAAWVIGQSVLVLIKRPASWLGPATGLCVLIVVQTLALRVSHAPWFGGIAMAVLVAASGAYLLAHRPLAWSLEFLPGFLTTLVAVGIPFLATARVGIIGQGINNDVAIHLLLAESLDTGSGYQIPGYPLGPHSIVLSLNGLIGVDPPWGFNAIQLVIPLIAAITVYPFFARKQLIVRLIGPALVALPYLGAAYFIQGAFKESLVGLFLLALVAWGREKELHGLRSADTVVPALLAGATLYVYGAPGAVWFVGAAGTYAVFWMISALRKRELKQFLTRKQVGAALRLAIPGAAVLVAVAVLEAKHLSEFAAGVQTVSGGTGIAKQDVGNLFGPVPSYEILGVWPAADFRIFPVDQFRAGLIAALSLACGTLAFSWWLRRATISILASGFAFFAIYAMVKGSESPYVAAKALAVAAPTTMLFLVKPAFDIARLRDWRVDNLLSTGIVVVFLVGAVGSSVHLLMAGAVGTSAQNADLEKFRRQLPVSQTAYFGNDDFAYYRLRGRPLTNPLYPIPGQPASNRPGKIRLSGSALDFDSYPGGSLDLFDYIILARSAYRDHPPPNWKIAMRGKFYDVWQRHGPTPDHSILPEQYSAGVSLDCSRPKHRRIAETAKHAWVFDPPPSIARVVNWQDPNGVDLAPLAIRSSFLPLVRGQIAQQSLFLTPGTWDLSAQYAGALNVRVTAPGLKHELDAYAGHPGPYYEAGSIHVDRPQKVRIALEIFSHSPVPARLNNDQQTLIGQVAAVRRGSHKLVQKPGTNLCGKYLDWYTPSN